MRRFLKILIIFVSTLYFIPLIISPVYDFPVAEPFTGDKIWNPYENTDTSFWRKANFQVQSRAWGGLTDGSNNTFDKVWTRYHDLDYDIIGISDYQKINKIAKDSIGYIPIYEHGYNFWKTHQINIGATKVLWLDFPLFQTASQKQFLINLQKKQSEIIALAHPDFSLEGYSHKDLTKLTNYDLLEALNMQIFSISHWDAALSAGRIAYIIANDDVHNIDDPFWYGRVATIINSPTINKSDILTNLKNGRAYGISILTPDFDTHQKKITRVHTIPKLKYVKVENNLLSVYSDPGVRKISFFGQNGKLLKTIERCDSAEYLISEQDTYIRTEIDYGRDQVLYLNPVFKYSGDSPTRTKEANINWIKTIFLNSLALLIYLTLLFLLRKWK